MNEGSSTFFNSRKCSLQINENSDGNHVGPFRLQTQTFTLHVKYLGIRCKNFLVLSAKMTKFMHCLKGDPLRIHHRGHKFSSNTQCLTGFKFDKESELRTRRCTFPTNYCKFPTLLHSKSSI